jgi:hypothetical protein
MKFKVYYDGFQQGIYDLKDVEFVLRRYADYTGAYRKDITVLRDTDDPESYGKILELPMVLYKDLTVQHILDAAKIALDS